MLVIVYSIKKYLFRGVFGMARNQKNIENEVAPEASAKVLTKSTDQEGKVNPEIEGGKVEASEETQKAAESVQKAVAEGKEVSKKYKLADPRTQYAEGDFYISGDQEKELPERPSAALIERIRAGFIVEV